MKTFLGDEEKLTVPLFGWRIWCLSASIPSVRILLMFVNIFFVAVKVGFVIAFLVPKVI